MPPMSDAPVTRDVLAQFHREVVFPDLERVTAAAAEASERRLTVQIERLWDALLGTGERLETGYVVVRGGLSRVEDGLARLEDRLTAIEERLGRMEGRLAPD